MCACVSWLWVACMCVCEWMPYHQIFGLDQLMVVWMACRGVSYHILQLEVTHYMSQHTHINTREICYHPNTITYKPKDEMNVVTMHNGLWCMQLHWLHNSCNMPTAIKDRNCTIAHALQFNQLWNKTISPRSGSCGNVITQKPAHKFCPALPTLSSST